MNLDRRFCIAPMLDWTDRHCRYWLRLIFPNALLYSEMVTTPALIHGNQHKLLSFDPFEKPLALQLGGNESKEMAKCAMLAQKYDYDEVNINVGCPSDRVQSGLFGACLMAKPQVVADCVAAMRDAVDIPVTVKTRIGIDAMEGYTPLREFVSRIVEAGCQVIIVHARKAWLQGLSPKENREIPPLQYDYVYRLKQEFQQQQIIVNGGIQDSAAVREHIKYVDGTMIGRAAYLNPYALVGVNKSVFNNRATIPVRADVVEKYLPYINQQLAQGVFLKHMTRHMLGLFKGMPGAKQWRRYLSEHAVKVGAGSEVVIEALNQVKSLQDDYTGVDFK